MDTKQLRYFVRIVELGSFSRAAENLRVAQSALSYHILQLEKELDVQLLDRHSRGVTATAAGQALCKRAQAILREFDNIRADVWTSAKYPGGEVSIAAPPSVTLALTPLLLRRVRERLPGVRLAIRESVPLPVYEWLLAGKADFAITYDIPASPDIEAIALIRDQLHLVGAAGLPSIAAASLDGSELAGLPVILPSNWFGIRRQFENLVEEHGLRPNIVAEVDSVLIIKTLVQEGLGYGVLLKYAVFPELTDGRLWAVPINGAAACSGLSLLRVRHRAMSPAVRELQEIVFEEVRRLVASGWGEPPHDAPRPA